MSAHRARFPLPPPGDLSGTPPGPRLQRHLLGAEWLLSEHRLLERCRRRYGDVFSLNMWPLGLLVVVCDPVDVKHVFTSDPESVRAGEGNAVAEPVAGSTSVLLLDGSPHMQTRKRMLPPFHGERLGVYGEVIREVTDAEIDRWPIQRPFPVHQSMQRITLRVILRAVFGIDDETRRIALERLIPRLIGSPALLWPFLQNDLGAGSPWRRFLTQRRKVDEILLDEIARKRCAPDLSERSDVLSMLIQSTMESGDAATDEELRDQLVTLLLAGHETTATALAWTFERLLRTPAALARLQTTLADDSDPYLDWVIKESLRSRPVIPYAMRRLAAPEIVHGYTVPAGAFVGCSTLLMHARSDLYPEPELFRPGRFADSGSDTYTWIPFGGGVRRCLGAAFATFEMKVIMRQVLSRCELETSSSTAERPRRRFVTYVPSRGARIVVRRRVSA